MTFSLYLIFRYQLDKSRFSFEHSTKHWLDPFQGCKVFTEGSFIGCNNSFQTISLLANYDRPHVNIDMNVILSNSKGRRTTKEPSPKSTKRQQTTGLEFSHRLNLMGEDPQWQTIFDGRRHLMEEHLRWKTLLIEDNL